MTEREPSLEALRREFEYRIRTAVTYGLGRGEHGDSADRDVAGWIDREIGAAMASLTVSQVIEAVRQEERDRVTPIIVANERSLLEEAHVECVMYADDVADGVDVPDDYERHYCETDGEDWPCAHARYEARIRQEERERCAQIAERLHGVGNDIVARRIREQGKEQDRG